MGFKFVSIQDPCNAQRLILRG